MLGLGVEVFRVWGLGLEGFRALGHLDFFLRGLRVVWGLKT